MIRIEKVSVTGIPEAIRGMRNPMNSWDKSDSGICKGGDTGIGCGNCALSDACTHEYDNEYTIGKNDYALMEKLAKAGTSHSKYRRMMVVYLDITAPLYWWKEFDTYKVGTVANSCSTMHKIHSKPFEMNDFSSEHLIKYNIDGDESVTVDICRKWGYYDDDMNGPVYPDELLSLTLDFLNMARQRYLETNDKRYWWQMIQLLPSSYNQKRTVMLNYEVLANIYHDRKNHKLDEWLEFCEWIRDELPYSKLITMEE